VAVLQTNKQTNKQTNNQTNTRNKERTGFEKMAVLDGGSVDQPAVKNAHSLQHHERDNSGQVNGFEEPEVVGKINLLWAGQR